MRIVVADLLFYIAHRLFHTNKFLQKIHLKHHEFRDTSSFVAGHKSLLEYVIVTLTDIPDCLTQMPQKQTERRKE
jgi:sterol desaturase/sphingolipid hydroxylase (fatty acid hydroxylase superfamily)